MSRRRALDRGDVADVAAHQDQRAQASRVGCSRFGRNALPSTSAAPVNSLSTSVPLLSWRQAIYSLATRFMPSRSEVTSMSRRPRADGITFVTWRGGLGPGRAIPWFASPAARRQARRKFVVSLCRWKPSKSAPARSSMIWRRHGSWRRSHSRGTDMCKVTDVHVAALLTQHPRNQLELVIVYPVPAKGRQERASRFLSHGLDPRGTREVSPGGAGPS